MTEVCVAWSDDRRFRALKGRWMDRSELEHEQARILAEEALRASNTEQPVDPKPGSEPGDKLALRGIPMLVRAGVGGAILDSRPGEGPSLRRLENTLRRSVR